MGRFLALVIISAVTFATLPRQLVRAQYIDGGISAALKEVQPGDALQAFKNYERLRVNAPAVARAVRRDGRISLATMDGTLNLKLVPNDLRAENYRAVRITGSGALMPLSKSPVTTYRGTVEGMPDAEARFTIDENHLEGLILTARGRLFVEPMRRYNARANAEDYILYKAADAAGEDAELSARTLNHRVNSALRNVRSYAPAAPLMPQAATNLRQVELATEADFEYVTKTGGATAANNEIQSVMNQVDAIYRREVGLTFKIVFQSAWETPNDPYNATDLVGLINEFTNYWNVNRTNIPRDLAHMWTGRDTGGSGVSWQGTVCAKPDHAYGITPFVVRNELNPVQEYALTAHEIGHSFNATHTPSTDSSCNNTIMNTIAGPSTQLTFCQRSRDEIINFVNANSGCLTTVTAAGSAVIGLSSLTYLVNENDQSGVAAITVNRTGDTSTAASVDYATNDISGMTPCQTNTNGIASERCDYATAAGTLRFAAGETVKTIQIPIINDAYVEPNESFTITLQNTQAAVPGSIMTATVTIQSEDTQTATVNPIDNQAFFIRQQYIDFLGRIPDAGGFQFWMNRMNNCPAGDICDRIDTSQRFFQSDEFQERGFYVYRLYDAILGRLPHYTEWVRDVARLNGFQTVAEQRQSKDIYLREFVNRPEFRAVYGKYLNADSSAATDPTGFVDALSATAGITPAARQTLINNLATGQRDPAHTLEDFILQPELSNVGTKFYDRGFITMQYFGYLRRDPDANGFNFWVGQLIGPSAPHRGDYRFMVGGFLQSDEYRFRLAMISGGP
jgi:hypothetical protein